MFSRQKGVHALNVLKWKWRNKSPLETGLLDDVPHEIELSDYQKAPSPGSESPSGFLDAETLNVKPIDDLDLFFERVYSYYCEKGLWCIIINWIFEFLSLAFTLCFSGFFLLYVDWTGLRNAKCGMDAVESGIKPCDLSKEALHKNPLNPFTFSKAIILGYLAILFIYSIFCFLRFFTQLKETLKVRRFYYSSLCLTDNEIQTMPWALVLEKVIQVQQSQQLFVVKDLSIHDVVMRMMRKENYLIGMINKGVLAFPIPGWVPGAGTTASIGQGGSIHRLVLPKSLEWTLNWCILQSMFDKNFHIQRNFVDDPEMLKTRLRVVGFALLLLSPFLIIFMLVYLFLRHAEQFYNHPSTASSRKWSNLSKWMFREFNEVEHLFKHRINSSIVHASDYLKQFPSPILTIFAKFVSFVSGGFAAVLIIIAFLEESLLEGHIFGRNLIWYAAVFGTITAISRAAIKDELLILDPQGAMSQVIQHTHYMPKRWRGKENTETVRMEFETLFQYRGMMLLEEMASIFLTPYLLLFVVPKRVDDILKFIRDFTVDVEGVGHVCSFSLFDFRNHGNTRYGSPFDSPRDKRSSQGKMEKSFLSFQIAYPSWEPDAAGKQCLVALKLFRDQKMQGYGVTTSHIPSGMQQQNPNLRGVGDRNSFFSREVPFSNLGNFHEPGSMWLIDGEQKNFPYIMDWYYTSQNHRREGNSRAIPARRSDNDGDSPKDFWIASSSMKNKAQYDENWEENLFQDSVQSDLEVSTSASLFQRSVLQQQESSNTGNSGRSHWWARTQPQGQGPQASFIEPPNFYHEASRDRYGTLSDRIVEEDQEQQLDLRNSQGFPGLRRSFVEPPNFYHELSGDQYERFSDRIVGEAREQQLDLRNSRGLSRTFYMDDLDGEDFNLPFVDIYASPSKSVADDTDPLNAV